MHFRIHLYTKVFACRFNVNFQSKNEFIWKLSTLFDPQGKILMAMNNMREYLLTFSCQLPLIHGFQNSGSLIPGVHGSFYKGPIKKFMAKVSHQKANFQAMIHLLLFLSSEFRFLIMFSTLLAHFKSKGRLGQFLQKLDA